MTPSSKTSPLALALAVAAPVALSLAGAHTSYAADPPLLTATAPDLDRFQTGLPIAATFNVTNTTGKDVTAKTLTVSVREAGATGDAAYITYDFPGTGSRTIKNGTTEPITVVKTFDRAKTYTLTASYQDSLGGWHNMATTTKSIWGVPNKHVVFPTPPSGVPYPTTGQFATSAWRTGWLSSFATGPGATEQSNYKDAKLDCLSPALSAPSASNEFGAYPMNRACNDGWTSTPGPYGDIPIKGTPWAADSVTTQSTNPVKVKKGDSITARVTLYATMGAWPAIWTWSDDSTTGNGEVDLFEYHPDNPQMLELTNHTVTGSPHCYTNAITPGTEFGLQVDFGNVATNAQGADSSVRWLVNGKEVCTTAGVPDGWTGYINVTNSVSSGAYHPAPTSTSPMNAMQVTDLTTWTLN